MDKGTEAEKVVPVKPTQQLVVDLHPRFPKLTAVLLLGALAQAGTCMLELLGDVCL